MILGWKKASEKNTDNYVTLERWITKARWKNWDRWNTDAERKTKSKTQNQCIKFIEIIRWCYRVVWGVERIQTVRTEEYQRLTMGKNAIVKVCSV